MDLFVKSIYLKQCENIVETSKQCRHLYLKWYYNILNLTHFDEPRRRGQERFWWLTHLRDI